MTAATATVRATRTGVAMIAMPLHSRTTTTGCSPRALRTVNPSTRNIRRKRTPSTHRTESHAATAGVSIIAVGKSWRSRSLTISSEEGTASGSPPDSADIAESASAPGSPYTGSPSTRIQSGTITIHARASASRVNTAAPRRSPDRAGPRAVALRAVV